MKANINNIQKIFTQIPSRYIVNGNTIDGYDKLTENHFNDGWRDVVIPEFNENQKLGNEFILVSDIVTKEVIELTTEEIRAKTIPSTLSLMKFIIQINRTTGIKYEDIEIFIKNIPNQYLNENSKYEIIARLKAAVSFNRYNEDLLTIAGMMGITSEQLDEIFVNGNLIN